MLCYAMQVTYRSLGPVALCGEDGRRKGVVELLKPTTCITTLMTTVQCSKQVHP